MKALSDDHGLQEKKALAYNYRCQRRVSVLDGLSVTLWHQIAWPLWESMGVRPFVGEYAADDT